MRPCDDCQLCCKVFPLPVLDKPAGAWCRHSCAGGCAVHAVKLPEICRQYDCFWREHDALPEAWRPDRIGAVITEAGHVNVGPWRLPVVVIQRDDDRADRDVVLRDVLESLISQGFAVMMIRGADGRIEFDRARYSNVSAEEIEAALRFELSQDAEELKRLGAVGDEYRPLSRDEAESLCRKERAAQR